MHYSTFNFQHISVKEINQVKKKAKVNIMDCNWLMPRSRIAIVILMVLLNALYPKTGKGQNATIDSLKEVLPLQKEDVNKADVLNKLSMAYYYHSDYAKSKKYAWEQLLLSSRLGYLTGMGNAYLKLGNAVVYENKPELAFEYFKSALKIFEPAHDTANIAATFMDISLVHSREGNYGIALKYLYDALHLYEKINKERLIGICLNGMGDIYLKSNDLIDAQKNFAKAKQIFEAKGDYYSLALCNSGIGDLHLKTKNFTEGIRHHQVAIEYFEKTKSYWDWANSLNSIGNIYEAQGDAMPGRNKIAQALYLQALDKYKHATKLLEFDGDKVAISNSLLNQANAFIKLSNYKQAEILMKQNLNIAQSINNKECLKKSYLSYALLDSIKGDTDASLKHLKLYYGYRDSVSNEANVRASAMYKMEYENQKAAIVAKLEQEKKDALATSALSKQTLINRITWIASLLLIAFGVFIFYRYKRIKKLENEKAIDEIRLRISRDIHDDIGSSLTKIAMLGNITATQAREKLPEVSGQLDKISGYARSVNNSMSEIVWAINPKQDTLENLLGYMRVHIREFLKDSGIDYKVNFPDVLTHMQLNPDVKRGLFLVLKESLNNIVRHARAKNVEIYFANRQREFEFFIEDDGMGLQKNGSEGEKVGNGLINLAERMRQINCTFDAISAAGKGCKIRVSGSL